MDGSKKFKDMLMETIKITRGRISENDVLRDFISFCALEISTLTDPVHLERAEELRTLLERYSLEEREAFSQTFQKLSQIAAGNVSQGIYPDVLGAIYLECRANSNTLKQDFSPWGIADLLGQLTTCRRTELPPEGYLTLNDCTCGSGILLLGAVQKFADKGGNPSEQLVIQATDVDTRCVQMTYIQLSLYGIPAVVVHGEIIEMKEYDRWYTPAYLWGKWVWRAPMSFGTVRNKSDETLKMLDEPMYGILRRVDQIFAEGRNRHAPRKQ